MTTQQDKTNHAVATVEESRDDERHFDRPIRINEIQIANLTMAFAIDRIIRSAKEKTRLPVFFVNADCFNLTAKHLDYRAILQRPGALILGDGSGVKLAGILTRQRVAENVNGTDMLPLLCDRCAREGLKVYFFGAKPGRAQATGAQMQERFPGLLVAGSRDGYFSESETDNVIKDINESGADILLAGLGEIGRASCRERV